MKKEWTEQDLRAFAENAQTAFEDVTLTEADEEAADTWQDDGLQVDYVLRNGQVDCVLRRLIEADGKLWQLQMTAPLAGSDLPEDRMTARERELCRDDMNHDFLTGVFNRRYFETEFCTRLDEWTDAHRCDEPAGLFCGQPVEKVLRPPCRAGGLPPDGHAVRHRLCG